jgi:putative DNA primase/helicase
MSGDYVRDLTDKAFKDQPGDTDAETIARLSKLSSLEYDRCRIDEAKKLDVRVTVLDKQVQGENKVEIKSTSDELVAGVDAWPDPVAGIDVLNEVRAQLNKHCVLPQGADIAITLWSVASYLINCFRIFPKLCLSSPEKRCGKTTTLEVIHAVSNRALIASNLSPAVLFRAIDAWQPTLLIDEADTFLHGNDELRGVINSGHTRAGAFVLRVDGDDLAPKKFSTWAPTVIAMIKSPPGTITDRSVMIPLKRKTPGDRVDKLPFDLAEQCHNLRRKLKRWADDSTEKLKVASPIVPKLNNDRAEDNWLPLLAVADDAGGEWPDLARNAIQVLEQKDDASESVGAILLSDINVLFAGRKASRLSSDDIVSALITIDDRPWAEWRHGKPLSKNTLARLLKPFGISSTTIRIGQSTPKGYELANFQDSFSRYLTDNPIQSATPQQVSNGGGCSQIQSATRTPGVALQNPRKASTDGVCCGVAVEEPLSPDSAETLL